MTPASQVTFPLRKARAKSSTETSFNKEPIAPFCTNSFSLKLVRAMTCTSGNFWRMRRVVSPPSIPGIFRSIKITSSQGALARGQSRARHRKAPIQQSWPGTSARYQPGWLRHVWQSCSAEAAQLRQLPLPGGPMPDKHLHATTQNMYHYPETG
jgi:hypothetical protein